MKNFKIINSAILTLLFMLINACASSDAQIAVKNKLSPGVAEVVAKINEIESAGINKTVELNIIRVLGYGPSSSPIASGSKLNAIATLGNVKENLDKADATVPFTIELKLYQGGVNSKDSFKWEIISISKNN
ncbi:MAG: hypothetical protein WCZ90_05865 [Melioribacteraceae bacterium]